jgi:hypothetical protein
VSEVFLRYPWYLPGALIVNELQFSTTAVVIYDYENKNLMQKIKGWGGWVLAERKY